MVAGFSRECSLRTNFSTLEWHVLALCKKRLPSVASKCRVGPQIVSDGWLCHWALPLARPIFLQCCLSSYQSEHRLRSGKQATLWPGSQRRTSAYYYHYWPKGTRMRSLGPLVFQSAWFDAWICSSFLWVPANSFLNLAPKYSHRL